MKADKDLHPGVANIRSLMRRIDDSAKRLRTGTKEQSESILKRGDFDEFRNYRDTLKSEQKLYDEATTILKFQYPNCLSRLVKR